MEIGDVFGDLIAEADARDLEHASEQCLERVLASRVHEMYALLQRVDYAFFLTEPEEEELDQAWAAVSKLLVEIERETK